MDADAYIENAIDVGGAMGMSTLSPTERSVFLISEAEVATDMGSGLDYLVRHFGQAGMEACAQAFAAVGATEIADALQRLIAKNIDDGDLQQVAEALIEDRRGYDYDSIKAWVLRSASDV